MGGLEGGRMGGWEDGRRYSWLDKIMLGQLARNSYFVVFSHPNIKQMQVCSDF